MHGTWHTLSSPRTAWGRGALLGAAIFVAVGVPAVSYVTTAADKPFVGRWNHYPTRIAEAGYVVTELGCASGRSAAELNERFRDRLGPILGLDNAHVVDLGHQRFLWLFNDIYFDHTNTKSSLLGSPSVRNVAVLQQRNCFTLVRRGDRSRILSFEPGDERDVKVEGVDRFFWPLGGELHGGRVWVFWAEMKQDKPAAAGDGISRHPIRTWLATYDATSLERLDFRPARNDGVFPQYGYAVASDDDITYLFGNSNLLNLKLEGGFYSGPHSATKMYLARVPRGQLDQLPEYRTAKGWSADPDDAVPISERFWTENGMQPRYLAGRWVSVTKVDGFWGKETIVEIADEPWGPWRIVSKRTIEPFRGFDVMNNYQPIILPYRDPSGDMVIVMSQNANNWLDAIEDAAMYRLHVYAEPWPFEE
jgi:hypothetical protein